MNSESCPMLYNCSKVKMTPMIRVLLRCTAAEAMKSICINCEDWKETAGSQLKASQEKDFTYVSPSGHKVLVMVGDRKRPSSVIHERKKSKGRNL